MNRLNKILLHYKKRMPKFATKDIPGGLRFNPNAKVISRKNGQKETITRGKLAERKREFAFVFTPAELSQMPNPPNNTDKPMTVALKTVIGDPDAFQQTLEQSNFELIKGSLLYKLWGKLSPLNVDFDNRMVGTTEALNQAMSYADQVPSSNLISLDLNNPSTIANLLSEPVQKLIRAEVSERTSLNQQKKRAPVEPMDLNIIRWLMNPTGSGSGLVLQTEKLPKKERAAPKAKPKDELLRTKLDEVLDKIAMYRKVYPDTFNSYTDRIGVLNVSGYSKGSKGAKLTLVNFGNIKQTGKGKLPRVGAFLGTDNFWQVPIVSDNKQSYAKALRDSQRYDATQIELAVQSFDEEMQKAATGQAGMGKLVNPSPRRSQAMPAYPQVPMPGVGLMPGQLRSPSPVRLGSVGVVSAFGGQGQGQDEEPVMAAGSAGSMSEQQNQGSTPSQGGLPVVQQGSSPQNIGSPVFRTQ